MDGWVCAVNSVVVALAVPSRLDRAPQTSCKVVREDIPSPWTNEGVGTLGRDLGSGSLWQSGRDSHTMGRGQVSKVQLRSLDLTQESRIQR